MTEYLTEVQRLETSGARAVQAFVVGGTLHLAVPQLAYDAEGSPSGINGGTSNTDARIFARDDQKFVPTGVLAGVGGEDIETFTIDGRFFLAVASIRMGSGPYNHLVGSPIYEWRGRGFVPFQTILTGAAKQWRSFRIGKHHFLGVAQGLPGVAWNSMIYRWNGTRFEPFQAIESVAGYNLFAFEVDGVSFLAHADHAGPSMLYRWHDGEFVAHQELVERGGRAFLLFASGTRTFLAVARIDGESLVLRWDGEHFVEHAVLAGGAGGREFALVETATERYVVRVNFILGSPAEPRPDLASFVYRVVDDGLLLVGEFATTGATDVTTFTSEGRQYVAVSHGLSAEARFSAECVIYRFDEMGALSR